MNKRIYLSPPHLDGRERELMLDAYESNWITTLGPHVDAFESEMSKFTGVPYAAALASGTSALHLALLMLGVQAGDEVLCSTFTFSATANAITYCGATPVFIDSNESTWNIDPQLLEDELKGCKKRGKLPRAVIVVDLYGQTADYDAIIKICYDYGVPIIEDAAEALGATYKGKSAGSFGEMGIFSFNGNKIITTSGGGMLVSHKKQYIDRARHLATQARDPAPHYQHSDIGYNYRMSNILAAMGRGQLEHLDKKIARRKEINQFYKKALAQIPGIDFMPIASYGEPNYWLTCIIIDAAQQKITNEELRVALEKENIESRPLWKPMHMQPVFQSCRVRCGAVTEKLFAQGLCLPSGSGMTGDDLHRVVDAIFKTLKK
jgi:pyridoxal phosphate-dependent aminotransferase EpsN